MLRAKTLGREALCAELPLDVWGLMRVVGDPWREETTIRGCQVYTQVLLLL